MLLCRMLTAFSKWLRSAADTQAQAYSTSQGHFSDGGFAAFEETPVTAELMTQQRHTAQVCLLCPTWYSCHRHILVPFLNIWNCSGDLPCCFGRGSEGSGCDSRLNGSRSMATVQTGADKCKDAPVSSTRSSFRPIYQAQATWCLTSWKSCRQNFGRIGGTCLSSMRVLPILASHTWHVHPSGADEV